MKRPLIIANWKCNGTFTSVNELVNGYNQLGELLGVIDVYVAPAMLHIDTVRRSLHRAYSIAAQNCRVGGCGSHTGEVAVEMLQDAQVSCVILGHSECRARGETDATVAAKARYVLAHGLNIIFCVGESQRSSDVCQSVEECLAQLATLSKHITHTQWENVALAYEPRWAIGSGSAAMVEHVQAVHSALREWVRWNVSIDVAHGMRIQYGGGVNSKNCLTLASAADVDGFLVGKASLDIDEFTKICQNLARDRGLRIRPQNLEVATDAE